MEIYESLIDFFGIVPLDSTSTMIDLINLSIQLFVGIYIVCFLIRSLFLIVAMPTKDVW